MRNVNLSRFNIRTDLIDDIITYKAVKGIKRNTYKKYDIKVSNIKVDKEKSKILHKREGNYTTIYFDDVSDCTNFSHVKEIFINEFKIILKKEKIKKKSSILIIGLGNINSTPDSLGPKVIDGIITTKHIYDLIGNLEKGFNIVSKITPGVMGTTGIETSDILDGIIKKVKPDLLIVIDALASDSINRVCKTIQITNAGINPGSGIGNKRKEISKRVFKIPVLAIGVPMVVDAVTIVSDTLYYLQEYFNKDSKELSVKEKEYLLGVIGKLDETKQKNLIYEVLHPKGFNLMVTPKEVDFLIEKLSKLIAEGINKTIHSVDNI